jgi:very-short-patch-repair endonuclease
MPHRTPPAWQRTFARRMKIEPTESEAEPWSALRRRQLGVRFRRQFPIDRYIVDFVCLPHRLVVEVDGSQHAGGTDEARDAVLARDGFAVMRFWSWEVMGGLNGVVEQIRDELALRSTQPGS